MCVCQMIGIRAVTAVKQWAPTLFSFRVTRPDGFKFTLGNSCGWSMVTQDLAYFANTPAQANDERFFGPIRWCRHRMMSLLSFLGGHS